MAEQYLNSNRKKIPFSFERKLLFIFLLIITVLTVVCFSISRINKIQKDTENLVLHTKEVLHQSEKINMFFKDIENQSRGYIITGWESFNETFIITIKNEREHLAILKNLTADNASQQKRITRLDSLIEGKIAFAQSLIVLRREKGFDAALERMSTKEGVKLAVEFTETIRSIQNAENLLLEERKKANEESSNEVSLVINVLQAALFVIIISVFVIVLVVMRLRHKASLELVESREWFSKTLSGIGDGVIATNENGVITYMNPVAESLTGWKIAEARGKPLEHVFEIVNAYTRNTVENPVKQVLREKKIVELANNTILIRKDRSEVHIDDSASPVFNATGDLSGVVLVFRDVEKQRLNKKLMEEEIVRRTEEAIHAEKRFRSTLDTMMEGAQIIDKDFRYVYVNDALVKMAQNKREDLIGYTMMEKYPGIDQTEVFKAIKKCMEDGTHAHLENEFTFPNGTLGCFELSIHRVPEGVFILSIDISERKRAEYALKQLTEELEKKVLERTAQLQAVNSELESFSYSVSHDLRAPLRAIDGYTKILWEDYGHTIDDEGKRIMNVITSNAKQMGQLIDDLLSFSRVGKQELIKVDLEMNSLVKGVADDQLSKNPGRKIDINVLPLVKGYGDHNMIKLVMTNLISNAIKYSSKKETTEIEIGSYEEDNQNVYYVKDHGAGFDMNYYNKLFGVFQRLHNPREFEGTGVGLALVQRVIFKHNGKVWAQGKEEEGATFYFSLPK